jgi:hypothetical protein
MVDVAPDLATVTTASAIKETGHFRGRREGIGNVGSKSRNSGCCEMFLSGVCASMQLAASLLVDVECMVSTTLFSLVAVEYEKTVTMNT